MAELGGWDPARGVAALTEAQVALWHTLVEQVRATPTEEVLRWAIGVAAALVDEAWSKELRADCYRARVVGEGLTLHEMRLYASARQWGTPFPLNHEDALRRARS